MIRIQTKTQLHSDIQSQTAEFLRRGGRIHQIAGGISGVDPMTGNKNPFLPNKKTTHSYLTKEVLAVETRRAQMSSSKKIKIPKLKTDQRNMH